MSLQKLIISCENCRLTKFWRCVLVNGYNLVIGFLYVFLRRSPIILFESLHILHIPQGIIYKYTFYQLAIPCFRLALIGIQNVERQEIPFRQFRVRVREQGGNVGDGNGVRSDHWQWQRNWWVHVFFIF